MANAKLVKSIASGTTGMDLHLHGDKYIINIYDIKLEADTVLTLQLDSNLIVALQVFNEMIVTLNKKGILDVGNGVGVTTRYAGNVSVFAATGTP